MKQKKRKKEINKTTTNSIAITNTLIIQQTILQLIITVSIYCKSEHRCIKGILYMGSNNKTSFGISTIAILVANSSATY